MNLTGLFTLLLRGKHLDALQLFCEELDFSLKKGVSLFFGLLTFKHEGEERVQLMKKKERRKKGERKENERRTKGERKESQHDRSIPRPSPTTTTGTIQVLLSSVCCLLVLTFST